DSNERLQRSVRSTSQMRAQNDDIFRETRCILSDYFRSQGFCFSPPVAAAQRRWPSKQRTTGMSSREPGLLPGTPTSCSLAMIGRRLLRTFRGRCCSRVLGGRELVFEQR